MVRVRWPSVITVDTQMDIGTYLKEKKWSRQTLEKLPVNVGTDRLEYLYTVDGEITGTKYRTLPKTFGSEEGSNFGLWNYDALEGKRVVLTEGENDAIALVEAGVPPSQVASLGTGASHKPAKNPHEKYAKFVEALQGKRVYLWMDNDQAGRVTSGDLTQALGAARCKHVISPYKDACEALEQGGADIVKESLNTAHDAPIVGLYSLDDLPEPPPREAWDLGIPEWEGKLRLLRGLFTVVTGHPGHGKSVLMMQIITHLARHNDVRPTICTLENQPKPDHRRIIRSFYHEKLEKDMTDAEKAEADEFINDCFKWIVLPRRNASLERVLDAAEGSIVRFGSQLVQIDPFNRIESQKPDRMSEHDYIGRVLDTVCDFAQHMRVHTQIVAHPKKMERAGAKNLPPPHLDDISGSKHWDNKSDQGIVIHRPHIWDEGGERTHCQVLHRKVKYPEMGHECFLEMDYDITKGVYRSTDYQIGPV